jgi:tetratricopeptide (TPR) repeat protein
MSLRRVAASTASLLGLLLVAAPVMAQPRPSQQPAQRGGPPKQDTPYILVPVLQSSDRVLGVSAADEIRSRIQSEHSTQELYVVPKNAINATLEASGYKADSALNASDLMELGKQLRGDYVLEGKINKTGTGNAVHLETRLLTRSGQQTLTQPLPAIDGKDPGDAAKLMERAITEALKGVPGYKACKNNYIAQKYDQAIKDAQMSIAAYPNSTLGRMCLLTVYGQQKASPDSIIAVSEAILQRDPTSMIALTNAADAYKAKGNKDKQIEYSLKVYRADPSNQQIAKSIIDELANVGSPAMALPIIDSLLVQNPGDPEILQTKWKVLLRAADGGDRTMWKRAIAAGEEWAKADTSAMTMAFINRQIGAAQRDSDAAKVQEIAAKGAQKFPKEIGLQLLLGQMYLKAGQSQQAMAAARKAMDVDPKSTTAALLAMYAANAMNQPDTAMAIAQKAIASGASRDTLAQVLLGNAAPAIQKAQQTKERADWEAALKASQTVDAVAPSPQSKFYIGVSAFSVAADALTNVQKTGNNTKAKPAEKAAACEELKVAEDNFATAQIAMPAGGSVDKNTAGQIMQGIQTYTPYIPQFKKALGCK